MNSIKKIVTLFTFLFIFFSNQSFGHAPNQSYIFLKVYQDSIGGFYEVTTTDIEKVFNFGLKTGDDFEKIKPFLPQIEKYILEHFSISSVQGNHPITLQKVEFVPSGELGDYLQYQFRLENVSSIPDALNIKYDGIFEADPTHRAFQIIWYNWKAGILENEANISLGFTPSQTEGVLDLTGSSVMKGFIAMIKSGVHHIMIGYDHILFLIALILPGVVRRREEEAVASSSGFSVMGYSKQFGLWEPVEKFKSAFIYIITIVTFFTIAHSITLSLAGLGIFTLPIQFVEAVIAFSIALAAFHNIRPIFKKDWLIAFLFGLFHGFGFASVLGDVGLSGEFLVLSLLGFNIGVELGQLAIIAVVFPILFLIRRSKFYPQFLTYGSILLIIVSLYWFVQRAFGFEVAERQIIRDLIALIFG